MTKIHYFRRGGKWHLQKGLWWLNYTGVCGYKVKGIGSERFYPANGYIPDFIKENMCKKCEKG